MVFVMTGEFYLDCWLGECNQVHCLARLAAPR